MAQQIDVPHNTVTTPLITRAQTDPLTSVTIQQRYGSENEQKAHSLFDGGKKYASHNDIMSDYKGARSIHKFSIEVVPIKRLRTEFGRRRTQEIVVPARDNLVKVPLWSTPLTIESTNHAFYDFKQRLIEMGLSEEAEAALIQTNCESVERAIAFIFKNADAVYHRFSDPYAVISESKEEDVDSRRLCAQCQKPYDQHLIDQNGNKIPVFLQLHNQAPSFNLSGTDEDIRVISVSIDKERIHELVQKTESLFPAMSAHKGVTDQCFICFDEKPLEDFTVTECGHNQYCRECLTEHYKVKTKDGDVLKVKCIDPRCEREVKEEEILSFITDDELKEKFLKFKRDKLLMLDENARFCPTVDCDGYMIGSRMRPKLVCPDCNTSVCFNCSQLWHGYFTKCTSAQNARVDENDEKFFQWELNKSDNVKKCPKCKMRIEKNEGCNHMICVSCKYEFCWLCKGKYTRRHYQSWNIFGCAGQQFGRPRSRTKTCCKSLGVIFLILLLSPIILALCILYVLVTVAAHILVCCVDCLRCMC